MTNFDKLTASPETLGAFLASIPTTGGPWDEAFRKTFCSGCGQEEMGVHLLTMSWQSPGHAGSRGPPPGKARGCQKPRATPPTRVA